MKFDINDEKELGFIALLFTAIVLFIYSAFFFQDNLYCSYKTKLCTYSHQSVFGTNTSSVKFNTEDIQGTSMKRFRFGGRKHCIFFLKLSDNKELEIPYKIYKDYKVYSKQKRNYDFNSSSPVKYNIIFAIMFLTFAFALKISKN